jgi:molybdate transport system substrate-binding protein
MSIDGIDVVGPFPEPYQKHTDFSAAVFTDSTSPELAEAFLDHLSDEAAGAVYARCGLRARTASAA